MSDSTFETSSAAETRALGRRIAERLRPGDVVLLNGDLGAGKTTMVQGIGMALGTLEPAQSPTFSLVIDTPLPGRVVLRHIDLYRLDDPAELETLGFEDLISDAAAITLIEWPERAVELLPERYLLIDLETTGPDHRRITVRPVGIVERLDDLQSRQAECSE